MTVRTREMTEALWVLEQYALLTRTGELTWYKVHGRCYSAGLGPEKSRRYLRINGEDDGYEWYEAFFFDEEGNVVWGVEVAQDDTLPEVMSELFRLAEADAGRDSKGYVQVLIEAFQRALRSAD